MDKPYLDKFDIMKRYEVGINQAMSLIRAIRAFNGGGVLSKGKVLVSEVTYWEESRGVK